MEQRAIVSTEVTEPDGRHCARQNEQMKSGPRAVQFKTREVLNVTFQNKKNIIDCVLKGLFVNLECSGNCKYSNYVGTYHELLVIRGIIYTPIQKLRKHLYLENC